MPPSPGDLTAPSPGGRRRAGFRRQAGKFSPISIFMVPFPFRCGVERILAQAGLAKRKKAPISVQKIETEKQPTALRKSQKGRNQVRFVWCGCGSRSPRPGEARCRLPLPAIPRKAGGGLAPRESLGGEATRIGGYGRRHDTHLKFTLGCCWFGASAKRSA